MAETVFYRLIGKLPVPTPFAKHRKWINENLDNAIVARDVVFDTTVVTVFTGIETGLSRPGNSTLFETVVKRGGVVDRHFTCFTWEDAEYQHDLALRMVENTLQG